MDADFIATGHYARSVFDRDGNPTLMKAVDPSKDQSYVLFGLGQEQLRRLLLPVGWYTKADLRKLARDAGLGIADKPDSQDICFIPDGDYRQFLQLHHEAAPGDVVDMDGNVLAQHQGVDRYTVGQRKGLGITDTKPLYVVRLEPDTRRVVIGPEAALFHEIIDLAHSVELRFLECYRHDYFPLYYAVSLTRFPPKTKGPSPFTLPAEDSPSNFLKQPLRKVKLES